MKNLIVNNLIALTLLSCCVQISAQNSKNADIIIGEKLNLYSEILNEDRSIFLSLPPSYDSTTHSYPVIIVMDAEYLFEITNAIVKIKASRNEMPESIIIGIPNNTGKRSDTALQLSNKEGRKFFGNYGGKAKDYLAFYSQELLPFIQDRYRINAHRSIIGMSPTFGPVLEAFWSQPNIFTGYIVLAAELSLNTTSGETVAQKLRNAIQDKQHPKASIYVGKAGDDLKRRPAEEAQAFVDLNKALTLTKNPNIDYKIEILENENHYGMSISGIERGLETIYPTDVWTIPYRDFWNSEDPAKAIRSFYDSLSNQYGFKIIPLEDSFYAAQTLLGTARRMQRQEREKALADIIKLAITYYPKSERLKKLKTTIKKQ